LEYVSNSDYSPRLLHFPILLYLWRILTWAPWDFIKIIRRSRRGEFRDLPPHAKPGVYPKYYLQNFHWQSDGWFSYQSARRYDVSVEFLFGGTAAIMRRMLIPHLNQQRQHVGQRRSLRVLEVACGTGSFLPQLISTHPTAELVGVDLSHDYLSYAARHHQGKNIDLVQAKAENLPFPDNHFDCVICINLYHELPKAVRRAVSNSIRRCLRPGGKVLISDAVQPTWSDNMKMEFGRFPEKFHEPYFSSYLNDPLENILLDTGFENPRRELCLYSQLVHAIKP
jgi:ubiquinone/menaquinone biosynthesis C-methylase UbiE